jgi:hypothetical protein
MTRYYLYIDGMVCGPFLITSIQDNLNNDVIDLQTLYVEEFDNNNWKPLKELFHQEYTVKEHGLITKAISETRRFALKALSSPSKIYTRPKTVQPPKSSLIKVDTKRTINKLNQDKVKKLEISDRMSWMERGIIGVVLLFFWVMFYLIIKYACQ